MRFAPASPASAVDIRLGRRVWSVTTAFASTRVGPDGNECFLAASASSPRRALHERVVPFPGWTLPGVIGLAAATVLLKSHAVLPGRRRCRRMRPASRRGRGGIQKLGGEVAAVVDLSAPGTGLRPRRLLATRPSFSRARNRLGAEAPDEAHTGSIFGTP